MSREVMKSVCNRLSSVIYRTSLIISNCRGFRKAIVGVSIPKFAGNSIFYVRLFRGQGGYVYLEVYSNETVFSSPLPKIVVNGGGEISSTTGLLTLFFERSVDGIIVRLEDK